jgi:hypothetical protein
MMKETKEAHQKTVEAVSHDCLYLIDAVLVSIIKAYKAILQQAYCRFRTGQSSGTNIRCKEEN